MKMKLCFDAPCNVTATSNAHTHATPDGLKGKITLLMIVPFFCLSQKEKQFK